MSKAEERGYEAYPVSFYEGTTVDVNEMPRDVFIEGYHQAEKDLLDNIWHSPDEEPEIDRKIIWESENFLGKHLDKEWKPKIDCFGRKERWCYLADILPSKNWTGERPYSKVDYSRGYDNGYKQAEKDLALTIDDVERMHTFLYAIKHNKQGVFTFTRLSDGQYQEVLNRFNKLKGKL